MWGAINDAKVLHCKLTQPNGMAPYNWRSIPSLVPFIDSPAYSPFILWRTSCCAGLIPRELFCNTQWLDKYSNMLIHTGRSSCPFIPHFLFNSEFRQIELYASSADSLPRALIACGEILSIRKRSATQNTFKITCTLPSRRIKFYFKIYQNAVVHSVHCSIVPGFNANFHCQWNWCRSLMREVRRLTV